MRWKLLVIFFLIFVVAVQTIKSDEDKVDDYILESLENSSEVPVIVQLKEETGTFSITEVKTSDVVEDLGEDFEKKNEYGTVFKGFSGNVTEEQLETLKNDERVERVYFDYPVKAVTINTINILNTSIMNAKTINGVNITGRDQTVCVIDTGVDYNNLSLGNGFGPGYKVLAGYDTVSNDGDPLDGNGHGSHIAGIIAGSGQIQGMAPGAGIAAFRALDNSGSGSGGDVVEGIDWCIGNSTAYNITVISLSLAQVYLNGSEIVFSNHCDGNDVVVNAANSARENGILVFAAAGNNGNSASIATPACGSNVTAIGAVDKTDSPSSFNSGAIMSFWAPGVNIYSVSSSGSSGCADGFCSGTSMAAPHAAGIAALLLQYKKFENGTSLKPVQVIEAMNKSGINVTKSGVTKVRVDAYGAIRFLDLQSPFIDINMSAIDVYFNSTNMTINFSAIDPFLDYSLINVTYPNGTQWFNSTTNVTIPFSNLTISGNYTVTLFSNDSNNNKNLSVKSFRIITPAITLDYPTRFLNSSDNDITINCSVKSQFSLVNLSLYHNFNGIFSFNQTVIATSNINATNFTFNNLSDGVYSYNCISSDDSNNTAFSDSNYTFTVDTTNPGVGLLTPSNASTETSSSATFTYNATDNMNITSCNFIFDGSTDQTDTTVTQGISQSFAKSSISNGEHTWAVSCLDVASNQNTSVTRNLTVSVSSGGSGSPGGGSGGGGGGGSKKAPSTAAVSEPETKPGEVVADSKTEEKIYVTEVRSEDLSKLIEEVANLKKGLDILFSEVNSIKESLREPEPTELATNRKITTSSDKSTLNLVVKFNGEKSVEDFIVYDEVPKDFAEDSDLIKVNAEGAKVTIVEKDPVYMFSYKNVEPGKEYNIEYNVDKEVETNVLNEFRRPIILVKDFEENSRIEQPLKEEKTNFRKYLFIGGGILLLIFIILGVILYKVEKIEEKEGLR